MSNQKALIAAIDEKLPQTQCEKCGYKGCLAYATAIVEQNAAINLCAPGKQQAFNELKQLVPKGIVADSIKHMQSDYKTTATIEEDSCIGCTKCLKVCPTDAIIGGAKKMHAILAEFCTGCELCLPVCPTDCINLTEDGPIKIPTWQPQETQKHQAKQRFIDKQQRLDKIRLAKQQKDQQAANNKIQQEIQQEIQACIARAKTKQKPQDFKLYSE